MYQFNPGFPYGWTPSNAYMANTFGDAARNCPPTPSPTASPPPGPPPPPGFNINQPTLRSHMSGAIPATLPSFNNDQMFPGMRFNGGIYPFGIGTHYNANPSNTQSAAFCGNWNYGYPDTIQWFSQTQQQTTMPSVF